MLDLLMLMSFGAADCLQYCRVSTKYEHTHTHTLQPSHNGAIVIYAQPGLSHRIVPHNQRLVSAPKTRPADEVTEIDITYAAAEHTTDANSTAASRMWY
jgi:hypothetical protein